VSYGQIASQRLPEYWDAATQTPWTRYQDADGGWHQIRYDDPTSIALKTRFAAASGLRGVGVWALGMDGNNGAVSAALLGGAVPLKTGWGGQTPSTPGSEGAKAGQNKASAALAVPPASSATAAPLTSVTGLTATSTPYNQIKLSWQGASGGVGRVRYQIFASKQADFATGPSNLVAETDATSFTHAGLGPGEAWWYVVRAIDGKGNVGPVSSEVSGRSGGAFLIEAESLLPAGGAPDLSAQQNCCGVSWSGGAQLLFSAVKSGQSVELQLPQLPAGKYELSVEPTLGPGNGSLGVACDGGGSLPPLDEYAATLQTTAAPVDLGQVVLRGPRDGVALTVLGKDAASAGYQLGIDYLVLRPLAAQQ
jgi:hypothetical protein